MLSLYIQQIDMNEIIIENEKLKEHIRLLENELTEVKDHLKKYTAPSRSKTYYETHKEEIIKKTREYKEKNNYYDKISKEKKQEYARTAYLNKKAKQNTGNKNSIHENIEA
jgi:hypothetical protein